MEKPEKIIGFSKKPKVYRNVKVMPLQYTENRYFQRGGIFNEDGNLLDFSLGHRRLDLHTVETQLFPSENLSIKKHITTPVVYGGIRHDHFGHFIMETLTRLWYIKKTNLPVIFVKNTDAISMNLIYFQRSILSHFKIDLVINIDEPTHIDFLIVPDDAARFPAVYTKTFFNSLECVDFKCRSEKLWISRSKLAKGKCLNEIEITDILVKYGWKIIYPEELDPIELANFMACSDKLAGPDGSAFHALLFVKKFSGHVYLFSRGFRHPAYEAIANQKGFSQSLHDVQTKRFDGLRDGDWIWTNPLEIIKIVEPQLFKTSEFISSQLKI